MILLPVGLQVGLTPWALHVGGRSTLLGQWSGLGAVEASNGGRYFLYVDLIGGLLSDNRHGRHSGAGLVRSDNLSGTAALCTESGATHSFKLKGRVEAWSTTDGAKTVFHLTGGSPERLPPGWVVAWHGAWRGPALELADPDSSFTEVFTPRGEIRHTTSTADHGTARVTLQFGSRAEFDAACVALKAR
jgi:hypothetical protein